MRESADCLGFRYIFSSGNKLNIFIEFQIYGVIYSLDRQNFNSKSNSYDWEKWAILDFINFLAVFILTSIQNEFYFDSI